MALNFPDNPSNGDTYSFGGKTYTYNSTKSSWSPSMDLLVPTYATVNDLPSSGSAGSQAFVTATNRLYIWNGSGWYNIALINTTPSISGVNSSYDLANDGTATVITITAVDAEGLPITYSIASDTSGNIATVTQGTGASSNVFTITPSTNDANAGTFSLTFRASDGVNIASSIASFELAFSVVNSSYTTALITSVGANNAVNNTFVDLSTNNYTITAADNATQTTFSPYRHGGYSTYFDGSGDILSIADNAAFNFGSGDSTIEMWVYPLGTGTFNLITRGTSGYSGFILSSTGFLETTNGASWTTNITFSTAITANSWQHVAVVRNGSTITVYRNGASIGTSSISGSVVSAAQSLTIGQRAGQSDFSGYMTDLRIVKGTAVYTSAFTPPTERLTAIANTSLLTCHLPYIADGSTNDHTITVTGDTSTQPFSPYDNFSYNDNNNGGSVYLDGSGDYLSTTLTTPVGSSDYQAELWAYVHSNSTWAGLMACRTGDTSADWLFGINRSLAYGVYLYVGNHLFNSGNTHIPLKQWVHLVLTREGNNGKIFMNGKQIASSTSYTASTYNHTNTSFTIGAGRSNGTETIHASIADARLKVGAGSVTYTSDFTPPTSPSTTTSDSQVHVKSTNAGIIDKSQTAKTLTLNGDVKSSTTQTKYLSSSMYFDGNDYILMPDIELDSADYTVECWAWISAQGGTAGIFSKGSPGGLSGITWSLEFSSSNNYVALYIYNANSGAYIITGSTNIITSSWNHIAVTRSGNETKLFINGTQDGSTYTGNYTVASGGDFYLGGGFYAPTTRTITGYMSDFRVTKGLARYTANFTPPTAELKG